MNEKKKSIGNEQSLPIDIINDAILEYLETKAIDKESLFLKVKEKFSGENRAKKASNAIYSVVTKPSQLQKALVENFTSETYCKLQEADKKIITLSLICLRFPFNYDLLFVFAKLFNVQDTVNRQYLNEKMASLYGSNLSLEHGIAAALAIAIDCGFIKRNKPGLYSKTDIQSVCDFAKEAWIFVFFEMNGHGAVSLSDLRYEPMMAYLPDTEINWGNTKLLHNNL